MAKRQRGKPEPSVSRVRVLKLRVSDEELRQVRVAAAVKDMQVSEFVRAAVLEVAGETQRRYLGQLTAEKAGSQRRSSD